MALNFAIQKVIAQTRTIEHALQIKYVMKVRKFALMTNPSALKIPIALLILAAFVPASSLIAMRILAGAKWMIPIKKCVEEHLLVLNPVINASFQRVPPAKILCVTNLIQTITLMLSALLATRILNALN